MPKLAPWSRIEPIKMEKTFTKTLVKIAKITGGDGQLIHITPRIKKTNA